MIVYCCSDSERIVFVELAGNGVTHFGACGAMLFVPLIGLLLVVGAACPLSQAQYCSARRTWIGTQACLDLGCLFHSGLGNAK